MPINSIKLDSTLTKISLFAGCLVCLVFVFFFAKWCLGNAMASRSSHIEVAELAAELAPDDPRTHYTLAVLSEKTFLPEDLEKALSEYEKAAALSPRDYRLWLTLGRVRQLNGNSSGAGAAYRKAIELAPNYAVNYWSYGNFLLKQGENEQAFAELQTAAEKDEKYFPLLVSVAWQIFGGDVKRIKQTIGNSAAVNAELAASLANADRLDESLEIWNQLPAESKKTIFKQKGDEIFKRMFAAKKYAAALQIYNRISEAENFKLGDIYNGGFENEVKSANAAAFDWQIEGGREPQIGVNDTEKRGGQFSLILVFDSATGRDFRSVSQLVVVEPEKQYKFEAFYKSDLDTTATLQWEIRSASDGKILATTEAVSAKQNWTNLTAEFTTDKDTEAVFIMLAREVCTSSLCPIFGKIRFDDLSLR